VFELDFMAHSNQRAAIPILASSRVFGYGEGSKASRECVAPKSAAIMMVEGVNAPPKEEAWVIGLCLPVSLLEQGPQGCFSDVLRLVAAI